MEYSWLLIEKDPRFTFVKMLRPEEMQFECADDLKDPCRIVKNIMYSHPYGRIIFFRVLIHGQFFENGKVYEDDPIKLEAKRLRVEKAQAY